MTWADLGPVATAAGWVLVVLPLALLLHAYLLYPAIMWVVARAKPAPLPGADPPEWPQITITLPAYNEERAIGATIESLLALDYPAGRRHILVVSDASTDRTDDIVRSYADRGVELLRLDERSGKTAAENAAARQVRGNIVVNTDATVRILPGSLKPLIRVFQDPRIGVASGRDVSVGAVAEEANRGESGYVGFEMWLRALETRAGSIVGASGCFYANRRELFDVLFPAALSRDFAAALNAVEEGYRAVSVDEAVCLVPRTLSLRSEFRRKVRTMTRGLETLWYKRPVLARGGVLFAFQLLSHKLVRWLVFPLLPLLPLGFLLLAVENRWAGWVLLAALGGTLLGAAAFLWPGQRRPPFLLALPGFLVGSTVAGAVAWARALRGELDPVWEPTRRPPAS
ncbi:MAG TPA: glycosyltransferase family 2 protein [Gemmatimonadales bacterium]|nr:glycosyltransferase family 2 protein [Gemmatimonadales bacterium]